MLQAVTDILLDCFYSLIHNVFIPLASFYNLLGLILGIFVTVTLMRFVFMPLVNGSTGVGKFISGSDHARKKDDP